MQSALQTTCPIARQNHQHKRKWSRDRHHTTTLTRKDTQTTGVHGDGINHMMLHESTRRKQPCRRNTHHFICLIARTVTTFDCDVHARSDQSLLSYKHSSTSTVSLAACDDSISCMFDDTMAFVCVPANTATNTRNESADPRAEESRGPSMLGRPRRDSGGGDVNMAGNGSLTTAVDTHTCTHAHTSKHTHEHMNTADAEVTGVNKAA
jgi:hypothetical protein